MELSTCIINEKFDLVFYFVVYIDHIVSYYTATVSVVCMLYYFTTAEMGQTL